jgi:nucleotide-binding universal stress UspA family protein
MTADKVMGGDVVVGVDGSADGASALQWAQEYALAAGVDLVLVTAWHWPTSYGVPIGWEGWDPQVDAEKVVDKARVQLTLPDTRVRTLVECGAAGEVLVRASKDAALLVVGTRGHGGLAGSLVGSVSSYCVHHAHCPVVVVR